MQQFQSIGSNGQALTQRMDKKSDKGFKEKHNNERLLIKSEAETISTIIKPIYYDRYQHLYECISITRRLIKPKFPLHSYLTHLYSNLTIVKYYYSNHLKNIISQYTRIIDRITRKLSYINDPLLTKHQSYHYVCDSFTGRDLANPVNYLRQDDKYFQFTIKWMELLQCFLLKSTERLISLISIVTNDIMNGRQYSVYNDNYGYDGNMYILYYYELLNDCNRCDSHEISIILRDVLHYYINLIIQ